MPNKRAQNEYLTLKSYHKKPVTSWQAYDHFLLELSYIQFNKRVTMANVNISSPKVNHTEFAQYFSGNLEERTSGGRVKSVLLDIY